jgi:hypothetical protein
MATVKEINHDSSLVLGDFYGSVTDPDGAVSVTVASALGGSVNGVDMDFDAGAATVALVETFTFTDTEFRWRTRVKVDNVTNSGSNTSIYRAELENSISIGLFQYALTANAGGTFVISVTYRSDSGGDTSLGAAVLIPSTGDVCIEIRAIRETTAISADGEIELFVNGVSEQSVSNVDNFANFNIAQTRIVWISSNANVTGNMFYDQWILDDDNTADLGCTADLLTLSTIPKPASVDASGTFLYLALLNNGTPILSKFSTALDADGTTVFDPGAGDAIGIECGRFDANVVWIAGAFDGTNVVEKSEDAGSSFVVKDDATIGDVRAFVMGPDNDNRLLVFDETNGDILETNDNGASWTSVNAAVTPEVNAVARLGKNVQESVFGNDGAANNSIDYSVNSGANLEDFQTGVYPNVNATGVIIN